jgi:hypothetical protein
MRRRSGWLVHGLLWWLAAGAAQGTLKTIETAWEASLSDVTLPAGANGYVMLRRCAHCRVESLRVNAETRYLLPAGVVSLKELKETAALAAGTDTVWVYVYFDPVTRLVRRLVLDPPR